jgi:hypothetical protein
MLPLFVLTRVKGFARTSNGFAAVVLTIIANAVGFFYLVSRLNLQ